MLPNQPRINDVKWQAGWPVSSEPRLDHKTNEALLEIPPDWNTLCQAAPRVAEDWHGKIRRALASYMGQQGYVAADFIAAEEGGRAGRSTPAASYVRAKRALRRSRALGSGWQAACREARLGRELPPGLPLAGE